MQGRPERLRALGDVYAGLCDLVTITTQADYDANKDCTRINGNLLVAHNSAVQNPELLNLTAITGAVSVTYSGGFNPVTGIRLPAIQTIGGDVVLSASKIARSTGRS